jgi:hypothetical protein
MYVVVFCLIFTGLFFRFGDLAKSKFVPSEDQNVVNDENGQITAAPFAIDTPNLVLGGIFSITDNGTNLTNSSGTQRAIAFECAIASINDGSAGINTNTKFFYNLQDDGTTIPFAVRGVLRVLEAGCPVVIGPSTSDQVTSSAPVYGAVGLPMLSYAATSDALADQFNFPTFFRLTPSDLAEARALATTCVYFNWSLITPIFTNDAYGQSGNLAFTAEANRNRVSFTCGRILRVGETNGIQNTNDCLSISDSNVVLLYMLPQSASDVLAAMFVPTNQRITFLASDAWADIEDFRQFSLGRFPPSFLEGTLAFAPSLGNRQPYLDCAAGYKPGNNDIPEFDSYWESTFHCTLDPDSNLPVCPPGSYRDRDVNFIRCKCNGSENLSQVPPDVYSPYLIDFRPKLLMYSIAFTRLRMQLAEFKTIAPQFRV